MVVVHERNDSPRMNEITDYQYDANDRLLSEQTGDKRTKYEYNENGIRVRPSVTTPRGSTITTDFFVDEHNPTGYAQVLEERTDGNGNGSIEPSEITKTFTLGHDVIAQIAGGTAYYLIYDGHGSTRALVDANGNIVGAANLTVTNQHFAYDAYGTMLVLNGRFAPSEDAFTSLLYAGEQTDATGLQYLRARFYDPASGRFNRLDPFAGNFEDPLSLHKYAYVHGDPVNATDPTGKFALFAALDLYGIYTEAVTAGFDALNRGDDPLAGFYHGAIRATAASAVGGLLGATFADDILRVFRYFAPKKTVWRLIRATQEVWLGTQIPRSFVLTTQRRLKVWVHPNATEHLAERVVNLTRRQSSPDLIRLTQQAQLTSLEAAVSAATKRGVKSDEIVRVGGWELKFGRPRKPGDLPTLFHALPLE